MQKPKRMRGPYFDCPACGSLVEAKVEARTVAECPGCGRDVEVWPVKAKRPVEV